MSLWAVLLTGLFAGGASCAAVQGGLLAGVVARRPATSPVPAPEQVLTRAGGGRSRISTARTPRPAAPTGSPAGGWVSDLVPVGGFLTGKLISHVALGAVLAWWEGPSS